MKSVDANIIIRWLTRDDPIQAERADDVMRNPVFVPLTVMIEVAWVLHCGYRYDRATLNQAMTILVDLKTVTVPLETEVRWALDRQARGADLPDMLHLIASTGAASFITFEKTLVRQAGSDTPIPVETLS